MSEEFFQNNGIALVGIRSGSCVGIILCCGITSCFVCGSSAVVVPCLGEKLH